MIFIQWLNIFCVLASHIQIEDFLRSRLEGLIQYGHLIWLIIILFQFLINAQKYLNYQILIQYHQERNRLNQHYLNDHLILLFIVLSQQPIKHENYQYLEMLIYFHAQMILSTIKIEANGIEIIAIIIQFILTFDFKVFPF
ncbi:unnamed protein product [Paramecium octaurelia]|uniref:Transmembrane protein n=1 Tax=Paramecium octaurelia TaxID=43137 RepID=A0A8S1SEX5_PAROT|nr:unnamed protein product [Paramecium octaurelia]